MSACPEYAVAYDCGHRTFTTHSHHAGVAWCVLCHRYVGVIVQRMAALRASDVVGAQTKPGTRLPTHRTGGTE